MNFEKKGRSVGLSFAASAALFLAAASGTAFATSVVRMDVKNLAKRSSLVFAGTVAAIEKHALADDSMAYTFVTFEDLDVLAGAFAGRTLTLRFDGGELSDGRVVVVPGMPEFKEGERVVLFADGGNGAVPCPITGWEQGHLRVVDDPTTGEPALADAQGREILGIEKGRFVKDGGERPGESGAEFVDRPSDTADVPAVDVDRPAVPGRALALEELRAAVNEIRAAARTLGPGARPIADASPSELPPTEIIEATAPPIR